MLRGIATISYIADDISAARDWYTELLGQPPYFVRPEVGPAAYVEFRVGDYQQELGLIDRRYASAQATEPSGAVVFWHVDDLPASLDRLLALGATAYEPRTERGQGFVTASVVDPFGNILGVMTNPHYLSVLGPGSEVTRAGG